MANSVNLTAAMRANLLSLQQTATMMGTVQFRLATGNKVNSALDNPSSYFAAQGLNTRASDLSALLDGMGQAVQTLKAADEGIKGLTTLLEQAKAVAQTAKTNSATNASVTGTHSFTAAEMADLDTVVGWAANDEFKITAGAVNDTFVIAANQTMQQLLDAINGSVALAGAVEATLVANTTAGHESEFYLKIATTDGSTLDIDEVVGTPATDYGLSLALTGTAADYSVEQTQYNNLRTEINNLGADSGYRGVNLLAGGSMTVQFNETNSNTLTVSTAQSFTATGLGITAASWTGVAGIDADIALIDTALTTLRDEASKFGNSLSIIQARQDFTTNLINTLKDGATALTIADKNEEGANLLSLQTSQQLGIQALALASQANQAVLRLFA